METDIEHVCSPECGGISSNILCEFQCQNIHQVLLTQEQLKSHCGYHFGRVFQREDSKNGLLVLLCRGGGQNFFFRVSPELLDNQTRLPFWSKKQF